MKTIILAFILSLSAIYVSAQREVYVCMGTGAYRYHYYRNCSGLSNCKATIKKMSLEEAKKMPNINGLCKKCEKKSQMAIKEHPKTENILANVQEYTDSCTTCLLEMKEHM